MGKVNLEPIKWTTLYAGTPLEPSVLLIGVTIRKDWVIRRKPYL